MQIYSLTHPILADEDGAVTLSYTDLYGWGTPIQLPWTAIVSVDRILALSEDLYVPEGDSLRLSLAVSIFDSLFAPVIAANPDFIDFGGVSIDTFARQEIVLDNAATGLLEITDIVSSSPVFSVDLTQGEIFAMDDSLVVTVTFTPEELMTYDETLTIISPDDTLEMNLTGIGEPLGIKDDPVLPRLFAVSCYPNPFNAELTVQLDLHRQQEVKVEVFNVRGSREASLWQGIMSAGTQRLFWSDASAPSGVYFIKLDGEGWSEVRKVAMLR